MPAPADPAAALPLSLDLEDFKGDFSFDALFGSLVDELLPEYRGDDEAAPAPPPPPVLGSAAPVFPAVDELLGLFKHSCKELVDLRRQIDKRLQNLKKEVAVQDAKHRKTLGELEKGVDGLFDSFARLDTRISSVGQTAAKIGDHLQSAESQRETASQTIDLIKYLVEFNSTPGDLMELSPLFSDDSHVAEAASIAQKLRKVERLLSSEQKATDYRSPDDGAAPDHRATTACIRIVAYLSRVLEVAFSSLEGLNKQSFLTELGNRLHKGLLNHWQKFTFSPSGGLRLKRDITEYGEFVRSFNAPSVDEKFELLGIMANVFIVAPESLSSLLEGTPSIRKDALRFIQLRDDYKTAKIASMLNSIASE